jgi:hypothetical protein
MILRRSRVIPSNFLEWAFWGVSKVTFRFERYTAIELCPSAGEAIGKP